MRFFSYGISGISAPSYADFWAQIAWGTGKFSTSLKSVAGIWGLNAKRFLKDAIQEQAKEHSNTLDEQNVWCGSTSYQSYRVFINLIMTTRVKTGLNSEESCVLLTAFSNSWLVSKYKRGNTQCLTLNRSYT